MDHILPCGVSISGGGTRHGSLGAPPDKITS
jgi:hypothetical protein